MKRRTFRARRFEGGELRLAAGAGAGLEIAAAPEGLPKLAMHAYTGEPLRQRSFPYPVVVDFAGVEAEAASIPFLRQHDPKRVVGHGSITVGPDGIHAAGVVSGAGEDAREVVDSARAGFPWQASIGARILRAELVKAGATVTVNGRTYSGPLIVARRVRVHEVSVVPLGEDRRTSTRIAAHRQRKGHRMNFEAWLEGLGIEAEALSDEQRSSLETAYRIEIGELRASDAGDGDRDPGRDRGPRGRGVDRAAVGETIREIRAEIADEQDRIAAIRNLCGDDHPEIQAEAIREGWTPEATELRIFRAGYSTMATNGVRRPSRDAGPGARGTNNAILEAAALMSLGFDDDTILAGYDARIREQAAEFRGLGLQDLFIHAARNEGADLPPVFGNGSAIIEAATSTRSLTSVVSNVVSKIALSVYQAHPIVAFQIAKTRSVPDFKSVSSYRLDGTGRWEKVAPDGKLEHGKLDDTGYTNQADTYGQVLGISRKDVINDDLGILSDIGRLMGMSGAAVIDHLAFTLLLANTGSFFHADNANLKTGADSAFGLTGLSKAREAFRKLKAGPGSKAKDQRPINVSPRVLLVPPELETDAEVFLNSAELNLTGSTDSSRPAMNPWRNKYRLAVAPHLSDTAYSGYSTTAWYLFADPSVVPAMELAFVNGQRTPRIERVPAPSDQLAIAYRGYLDVGVAFVDPKGALKSAGT